MMDLRPNAQTLLIVVASRHTCPNSGLTGWGLSNTDLDDIPKVDLLNELRLDTRLLKCVFERDGTKLRRGQGLQRTVDRAYRRPRRSHNNGFVTLNGGGLRKESETR